MKGQFTSPVQRLVSVFLAKTLLERARHYRTRYPQMAVFAHDFIGIEIGVYGRYEAEELGHLSGLIADLDRSGAVLDVGANIGNHTLFFAGEGFARVHAFEPNPRTVQLLRFNTGDLAQIAVHAHGLSARAGTATAIIPRTNAGGASLQGGRQEGGAEGDRVAFDLRRFDDLAIAGEAVALVKLDVEGHEAEVVDGMRAMLARDAPTIIFECNRGTERAAADRLVALLGEIGYDRFTAIDRRGSAIPQWLPRLLRRPLRLAERLVSSRAGRCAAVPVTAFEDRNYPMVVAMRRPGRN